MIRIPPKSGSTALRRTQRALLGWYDRAARDLPWRRTHDPYAIWVSEAMLQQTTVETVVPYYTRFLSRYPDAASLASAGDDALLAVWSGLGYYRRARLLKTAAGRIVERHGGRVPSRLEEIRALPGVGRYTAGAIASIAFGVRTPVVDGNVVRVLSRLFAISPKPRSSETAIRDEIWRLADALVPAARPGDWNQALMELGATLCRPARPACGACPLARECAALAEGDPARYPPPRKRPAVVRASAALVVIERGGRILLIRRPGTELLGGLWELPGTLTTVLRGTARPRHGTIDPAPEEEGTENARAVPPHGGRTTRCSDAMSVAEQPTHETRSKQGPAAIGGRASQANPASPLAALEREFGFEPSRPVLVGTVRHAVTHRSLTIEAWRAAAPRNLPARLRARRAGAHMWIEPAEIEEIPIGAASRKIVRKVLSAPGLPDSASRAKEARAPKENLRANGAEGRRFAGLRGKR